ncbi:MAG: hypothetical protein HY471_01485 [Candidatus Sungbacteria bacterium]|nr:hypothetical protein [Candidatus Sungbacteria bacterium]
MKRAVAWALAVYGAIWAASYAVLLNNVMVEQPPIPPPRGLQWLALPVLLLRRR